MSLTLDSRGVERLRVLSETLLSPLLHGDLATWGPAVLRAVSALHGADRAELILPINGGVTMWMEGVPQTAVAVAEEFVGELQPGYMGMKDPAIERAFRLRHAADMRVWSYASVELLTGAEVRRCPFYQEFMVPAGVACCYGVRVPLPLGDAHLATGFSRPACDRRGVDEGEQLLGLVLPAFRAAVHVVRHLHLAQAMLPDVIDELGLAMAMFDTRGNEVHRTPSLCGLLEGNPQAPCILGAARELAGRALTLRSCRRNGAFPGNVESPGYREIAGGGGRWQLRACFLPWPGDARSPVLLVLISHGGGSGPPVTLAELRARGLTEREAEVSALLLRGASNAEIAGKLGISSHTARKHTEHIFDKLGVHTRKAFLLGLAAASDGRPAAARSPLPGARRAAVDAFSPTGPSPRAP